jgi:hypothetical protein
MQLSFGEGAAAHCWTSLNRSARLSASMLNCLIALKKPLQKSAHLENT